jgi:hypothetical protein
LALKPFKGETTTEQDNREEDTQIRQHCQRLWQSDATDLRPGGYLIAVRLDDPRLGSALKQRSGSSR